MSDRRGIWKFMYVSTKNRYLLMCILYKIRGLFLLDKQLFVNYNREGFTKVTFVIIL